MPSKYAFLPWEKFALNHIKIGTRGDEIII
jgi:hypothetical protein